MDEPEVKWWRSERGDWALSCVGLALAPLSWIRGRDVSERLADVHVPRGMLLPALMFARIGQRRRERAYEELGDGLSELGTTLATRMRENDQRQQQLVDLQASLERMTREGEQREKTLVELQVSVTLYTRWLLALTVVLAVLGIGTIGVAIWAAM